MHYSLKNSNDKGDAKTTCTQLHHDELPGNKLSHQANRFGSFFPLAAASDDVPRVTTLGALHRATNNTDHSHNSEAQSNLEGSVPHALIEAPELMVCSNHITQLSVLHLLHHHGV